MDHQSLTDTSVELYRFAIPLTEPVSIRGRRMDAREGLVLVLRDADGRIGAGEASPLPGFSTETIDEAVAWLREWVNGVPPKARLSAPRSALFAVSQAMVELKTLTTGWAPHRVLSGKASSVVHANAVILSSEDLTEQVQRIAEAGFRAVKLKVGGDPLAAADSVATLGERLRPGVVIRLDANRAWSMDRARAFAARVPRERIDYIEEPLADAVELAAFARETRLPVALDESVAEWSREALMKADFARAFVLKPMVLGGAGEVWRLIRLAGRVGARCVFSGAFETDLGRRHLLAMAAAWGKGEVHGIDTARFLSRGLSGDDVPASGAVVHMSEALGRLFRPDFDRFQRLW